jgi:hypothetical protein
MADELPATAWREALDRAEAAPRCRARRRNGRHSGLLRAAQPLAAEGGLTLDLAKLRRGAFGPGYGWGGTLRWTDGYSGRHIGSVGYEGFLNQEYGRVRLTYTSTLWGGHKQQSDYWIDLATTPQPFGGRRWWFVCPKTGDLASKLHLPPGALTFASRKAHKLAYRSQRETRRDRALGRAFKLRRRLGDQGGIGEEIAKPKGMRWRTFDREMVKVEVAEAGSPLPASWPGWPGAAVAGGRGCPCLWVAWRAAERP